MKYTEKYLNESMAGKAGAAAIAAILAPVIFGKRAAGAGVRLGASATGVPTISTMAQDVGLGQRQNEWLLQGAKAGFGGGTRGSDRISKAVIGNLPIQSELLRTVSLGIGGRPTWSPRRR